MKKFSVLFLVVAMLFGIVGCDDYNYPIYIPDINHGTGGGNSGGGNTGGDVNPDEDINLDEMGLVGSSPLFVTDSNEDVIIYLNTKGTEMDPSKYSGEIYAHTGVITNLSVDTKDWKYVKSDWGVDIPEIQLSQVPTHPHIYALNIVGGPRAYYGVPEGEEILQLAFVFRAPKSKDCKPEVKAEGGADIFVELTKVGLDAVLVSPTNGEVWKIGETYTLEARASAASYIKLMVDGSVVAESDTDSSIKYDYTAMDAKDLTIKVEAGDGSNVVEKSASVVVLGSTPEETRPAGVEDGVTLSGNEATFVLYAPGKESVILLGDFNNYTAKNDYVMKRDGDYFWTTVTGLEANTEYGYQFLVDGSIKVGDPYATKILDPWNDKYISASVYPNLKAYPREYTDDIVSVFSTSPSTYAWRVNDFVRPHINTLAIYELLIRDFHEERTIMAVKDKLQYLKNLGINAIELMPIQEFDGNDSWGYNPSFYFAADKAYGTEEDYKAFIDACHEMGIAVILDVVFNHATGSAPWAKMWWDAKKNCTLASNPFFNVSAPHNFSVFHDFRHLYPKTQEYFCDVLKYWMEEYKVDGFRFDLTKGFVQNPSNYDAWNYSSERIGILSVYANAIKEVDSDAYIIFEHFCDPNEENELYEKLGAHCWNNAQLGGYQESVMGYTGGDKSSFSNFMKGRINNIETHDEERVAYKAITYGQSYVKNDWGRISKHLQAAYAMHFLTPYPKMMWQFGELGYDFSIEANENGVVGSNGEYRTHRKPIRWDYFTDAYPERMELYLNLSKVINFRTSHPEIYSVNDIAVNTWKVKDANMGGKTLVMDRVICVANFTNANSTTTVNVPATGEWENLITGEKSSLSSTLSVTLAPGEYVIYVR